jgi:hypothetical protein
METLDMTGKEDTSAKNEMLLAAIRDTGIPAADRSDVLIFNVCENGLDFRRSVEQLVAEADLGRELKKQAEAMGKSALASERFLGTFRSQATSALYAMVTRGQGHICLPAKDEEAEPLQVGDSVLVDVKQERVIGLDGHAPMAGEVVPVDSKPAGRPGHVIVKYQERLHLARLHHSLIERPDLCQPGASVVYDPLTQFVLASIETGSDGDELLVDPATIAAVRRCHVAAPKRVIDEILQRVRLYITHPEWIDAMQARQRCSYLFVGGTGGGKSFHLKLLVNEIHDLVEQHTGQRTSRLVMVDASQFWDPLFGATEQKIVGWFARIEKIARRGLRGLDGREVVLPLVIAIEECEALFRSRGDMSGSGHLFDRPLSLLLQKIESLESTLQVPIIFIATSNRADLADAAALRRIGVRQVCFGSLRADEALAVLKKKTPDSMTIYGEHERGRAEAREALYRAVIGYLYGPTPKQPIAEVRLGNSERRPLNRRDVVTPALLEEATSAAVDSCLHKSDRAGRLLGLDAADVIGFLHRHFVNLARTLRPHNVAEHATDWFERERPTVVEVVPLVDDRRPTPFVR